MKTAITVTAMTPGVNWPSARFRVRQYIELLREAQIAVTEYAPPAQSVADKLPSSRVFAPFRFAARMSEHLPGLIAGYRSDVSWVTKGMLTYIPAVEALVRRPIVFDIDDAVFARFPTSARWIARRSRAVVAGNAFLADWFSGHAREIHIVPTAIDTERYRPGGPPTDRFTVGWIGTSSNLPFLSTIEPALQRFLDECPDAELLICADLPPPFRTIPRERFRYVPWSTEREVGILNEMSVGLMPLPDTDWARGKCSFKMLQYMSCGIPTVVSPVGMNNEILALGGANYAARTDDEWVDHLRGIYRERDQYRAAGSQNRDLVIEHFGLAKIAGQLAAIFRGVI